jgi:F-type H+-transporting ATPase subunit delta
VRASLAAFDFPAFVLALRERRPGAPTAHGEALKETGLATADTLVSGMTGRYASALFALADETHSTAAVAGSLKAFDAMIAESADLERLVRSPVYSADEQVKALGAVLERAEITGVAANFIKLVAAKRRLFAVRAMIADYNRLHDAERGVVRAEVTVAAPLSDAHVAALKQELGEVAGGKQIDITTKIDPSIIGGSLRTKLNSIRTRMKEVG